VGDASKVEVTQELATLYEFTLTLVDLDLNGGLAIGSGQGYLRLLRRNGSVTANEFRHDSTESFDTCAQRVRQLLRQAQKHIPREGSDV
jgi:hypothetical protein